MLKVATVPTSLLEVIRPTTLLEPPLAAHASGTRITLAAETFQHTGSFKFRAAYNVAMQVPEEHLIAASSGNFGQALAYSCRLLRKRCTIVMPSNSADVKVAAVRSHGAEIDLIDTQIKSRTQRVTELKNANPDAYVTSAFDDDLVIQGNATLGSELNASGRSWDAIIAPVGGGGLISGIALGLREAADATTLIGAEPALGNDAARSLRAGHIVANESEPPTIADGARTLSLGSHNWPIVQREVTEILEVSEQSIARAVRILFQFANLKVEPTGALSLASVIEHPGRFSGMYICCIVSGGNVDPQVYSRLLTAEVSC